MLVLFVIVVFITVVVVVGMFMFLHDLVPARLPVCSFFLALS
jgi:hypothetical protein